MSPKFRSVANALCPPILRDAARSILAPVRSTEETELARLRKAPRNVKTTARLLGRKFQIPDGPSFASIYDAYFRREEYQFPVSGESPLIIDGGANVGIGVLYWKQLCPTARVVAFEPDSAIFEALSANCSSLPGVTLRKAALWTNNNPISFSAVGADGGHLTELAERKDAISLSEVKAVRLRDLLVEPVELLKLDIEGAEVDVLLDCADRLASVKWLFVEYHSFVNKPQRLGKVLEAIEQAGFRLYCQIEDTAKQPFVTRPVYNEKDFRLKVFGSRVPLPA